jgi:hypothetical protein
LEYGDFDINYPANHIVVSSGISKPTAVYSAEQNRLAKAKLSDKTVFIRTEEEVAALANSTSTATKTWHFKKMLGFVLGFFSGIYFIGPSGNYLSAYPVESAGNEAWDVQQNLPRHPLKIILKDGLSILIRLLQM